MVASKVQQEQHQSNLKKVRGKWLYVDMICPYCNGKCGIMLDQRDIIWCVDSLSCTYKVYIDFERSDCL